DSATPSHDDVIDDWNTQSSAQWDGFRHFGNPEHGHYGGLPAEEHGIHHWAERGLTGRCVLADVDRWRTAQGRPLQQGTKDPIDVDELSRCLADQGTPVEVGDVLLLRTGWTTWYRSLDQAARIACASNVQNPGLLDERMPEYLWNLHIAAIGAD